MRVNAILRSRRYAAVWFGPPTNAHVKGSKAVMRARLQQLIEDHYWVGQAVVRSWIHESSLSPEAAELLKQGIESVKEGRVKKLDLSPES